MYAPYDAAFSARCLDSARRAWAAAKAHPDVLAPATDNTGGGAYEDADVSDEFYWAAAELLATTGESQYRDAVTASPHHTKPADGFWWGGTATLGRITLATVPGVNLPADDLTRVRGLLTSAADGYLCTMALPGLRGADPRHRLRLGLQQCRHQQRDGSGRRLRADRTAAVPRGSAGIA